MSHGELQVIEPGQGFKLCSLGFQVYTAIQPLRAEVYSVALINVTSEELLAAMLTTNIY